MVTNVYMSNMTAANFSLSLHFNGPSTAFQSSFTLLQNTLGDGNQTTKVMSIDRTPGSNDNTTEAELQVTYQGVFIGAYKVVLGGGIATPIYYGMRTPNSTPGCYENNRDLIKAHSTIGGLTYNLTLQSVAATGFYDLYITIGFKINRPKWMEVAGTTHGDVPLNQWVLPGTHDSGTSSITSNSAWAPDAEWYHYVKTIVAKWAKTQTKPIQGQLNDGIRYFDLRVAKADSGTGYAFVHSLEGDSVEAALEAVQVFLANNTQEIVILDFNKFYATEAFDHAGLVALILKYLGPLIIPPQQIGTLTPNNIWRSSGRVIVAYADDTIVSQNPSKLWPRQEASNSAISSPWPNTNDITVLKQKLDASIINRTFSKFFVLQCVMTPGALQLANLASDLQNWAATTTNPFIYDQLKQVWITQKPNIIMLDFYEDTEIIDYVISANFPPP